MFWFFLVAIACEEVFIRGDEWSIAMTVDIEGFFVHGDILDFNNFMVDKVEKNNNLWNRRRILKQTLEETARFSLLLD